MWRQCWFGNIAARWRCTIAQLWPQPDGGMSREACHGLRRRWASGMRSNGNTLSDVGLYVPAATRSTIVLSGIFEAGPCRRGGAKLRGAAFLFEANDRLSARNGDFAVDDGAFRDGNGARDDVGVDDCGRADFQFVLYN